MILTVTIPGEIDVQRVRRSWKNSAAASPIRAPARSNSITSSAVLKELLSVRFVSRCMATCCHSGLDPRILISRESFQGMDCRA